MSMKTAVRFIAMALAAMLLMAVTPSAAPTMSSVVTQVAGGDPPDGG
jgi:hypothetical protein